MSESFNENQDVIRSVQEVNAIINNAITEAIELFKDELTKRDLDILQSVVNEKWTDPDGRIVYLLQTRNAVGVSEKLTDYINQILLTVKQNLTKAEIKKFHSWSGNMLDGV